MKHPDIHCLPRLEISIASRYVLNMMYFSFQELSETSTSKAKIPRTQLPIRSKTPAKRVASEDSNSLQVGRPNGGFTGWLDGSGPQTPTGQ